MTEWVKNQLALLRERSYRAERKTELPPGAKPTYEQMPRGQAREAARFVFAAQIEEPVFYGEDLFGFHRRYCAPVGMSGRFGNCIPDYAAALADGLEAIPARAKTKYPGADEEAQAFYDAVLDSYAALFALAERYRVAAQAAGHTRLAAALAHLPRRGARDYYEALVMIKVIIYALRLVNTVHLPLGRFDQYMKPYYDRSLAMGATEEELKELTALFFLSINFDTDLYIGIQQGDNGQSMVLGGCDREGHPAFNALSEMCLQVSEELDLIDPKINLRVDHATQLSLYECGTRLTRHGLGFPQYSNDDIAIPFLTSLGYDLPDARDYAMAACWEFIIPACGGDTPNVGLVNFPRAIEKATSRGLGTAATFSDFMEIVREELVAECEWCINRRYGHRDPNCAPLLSSFLSPCIERGRDVTAGGAKYTNFGFHGAGIATAADAVAAIKRYVYEEASISAETLSSALACNFEGYDELRQKLLSAPKMGNNDDYVDGIAARLMDIATETVNGRPNGCGGVFRMGTGTAMGYVLDAAKVGATADGRLSGGTYGCSFSPSPLAATGGPLSAIQSFTKYDMRRICNGGPFTIEVHDTVFRNAEGERKVAQLVKTFIDLGGHQIQINAVNRERLLHAKAHPEDDPNLIVRVWGWSGYFNELDAIYQDHVIHRVEHRI